MGRWKEIVTGRRRGLGAGLARAGLGVVSVGYRLGQAVHGGLYGLGLRRIHEPPLPVVSVGNLVAGGTGKTPLVEALARDLRGLGHRVAILSRGYGAPAPGQDNDEVALLRENLGPDVLQVVGADRVASAHRAKEQGASVAVLDDGFQHRRLGRSVDLVVVDGLCPWGLGRLLPRGMLREPASAVRRAHAVVVTRVEQAPTGTYEEVSRELERLGFRGPIASCATRPSALRAIARDGSLAEPGEIVFGDGPVAALSAVGNPDAFAETVRSLGAAIALERGFADHHRYCRNDLQSVVADAKRAGATRIITTQKDGVKLREVLRSLVEEGGWDGDWLPLEELRIAAELRDGGDAVLDLVHERVGSADEP